MPRKSPPIFPSVRPLCPLCLCVYLSAAALLTGCGKSATSASADELLDQAWSALRLQEFDKADADFQNALHQLDRDKSPNPAAARLRLSALYGRGLVRSLNPNEPHPESARPFFEQVIALDPAGDMAAWAALAIARDQHLRSSADSPADLAPLKAAYGAVIDHYPATPAAEEAFMYQESLLVQTFTPEDARQAITDLHRYLDDPAHAGAKLRTALFALLAQAHENLHQFPEALAALIASLNTKEIDPANPYQNNILEYYRIGMMAQYDVGDFATARQYYQRFLREYPNDQRAFTVALMLRQLERNQAQLKAAQPVTEIAAEGGRP